MTDTTSPIGSGDPSPEGDDVLAWAELALGTGPDIQGGWFEVEPQAAGEAPLAGEASDDAAKRALLSGDSPRQVLRRIWEGDPLGLAELVPSLLDEVAVIMDPQRVTFRALAQVAHRAVMFGHTGAGRLVDWLRDRILEAIESLLDEDWAEERQGLPLDPLDDRYRGIIEASDLAPAQARRLALTFNRLPDDERKPLYATLVRNEPLGEVAERFDMDETELRAKILAVLAMFQADPNTGDLS